MPKHVKWSQKAVCKLYNLYQNFQNKKGHLFKSCNALFYYNIKKKRKKCQQPKKEFKRSQKTSLRQN